VTTISLGWYPLHGVSYHRTNIPTNTKKNGFYFSKTVPSPQNNMINDYLAWILGGRKRNHFTSFANIPNIFGCEYRKFQHELEDQAKVRMLLDVSTSNISPFPKWVQFAPWPVPPRIPHLLLLGGLHNNTCVLSCYIRSR